MGDGVFSLFCVRCLRSVFGLGGFADEHVYHLTGSLVFESVVIGYLKHSNTKMSVF